MRRVLSSPGREAAPLIEVKDVQDYPPMPTLKELTAEGDLNGDLLIAALVAALPYCATETTRPVLNRSNRLPG